MQGDTTKAEAAYQGLLTLWKDADPTLPSSSLPRRNTLPSIVPRRGSSSYEWDVDQELGRD